MTVLAFLSDPEVVGPEAPRAADHGPGRAPMGGVPSKGAVATADLHASAPGQVEWLGALTPRRESG